MNIESIFKNIDPVISSILNKSLDDKEISEKETIELFESENSDTFIISLVADEIRKRKNGNIVTYVINRNINFTNVCIKQCGFCAFSRDFRTEEGYLLPIREIVRRAEEAWKLGATEVCIQAGLPPNMDGMLYVDICRAIKDRLPDIHIHAFSPEEVLYGSIRSNNSIYEYLKILKEAGLGSLPGTSAEILVKEVRNKISPGRIKVEDWVDIISSAHRLGIPTTSTIMYGHIETPYHIVKHLELLRNIQKQSGMFTEFVPLSYIHNEAPMSELQLVDSLRSGANGFEVIKMHSISRIYFNNFIHNLQVSWVKEGPKISQMLLNCGVNDFGGCLINESISTAAGAQYGQFMRPKEIRKLIYESGRIPAQRSSRYEIMKKFNESQESKEVNRLDEINPEIFGSYNKLIKLNEFRYRMK
ncbi:MAG: 5-amino-6-(D-ribitylamino)uracil--L-tyrosine 4-hydroxyphenyl transferase CofH [Candidatus Nitrosocosmicus sp.]|jgi:FO synthase subunit 2|uniref:5-amino-6-(D-ribitylamino)uracil--L-tyrosine 4-hydroxyphenyl transferase CofH n=1 Tax=Candidatus Nitrosocosmicus agrestis TaxID=2563600 RepID=UPI00122E5E31|nr:5-amino-6-(D-ribitylamino)uracil--L-tyrosine 4-hydroxyphenyl transferase CofH [Candidatus Nitrosocosmicus sp. SS]KAA2279278.1 7,8-didemethyl-8-hydroxy-5-deazariboflavin synthase subunit CofH [Candidatus Nitrosocosmicus sp. SS]KAF0867872.1 7,8-didemethyl-8-hydroxy-5-deazariboflavin synthase subunit CofH [Candidatus Nitrosocosmicus sp. SS]